MKGRIYGLFTLILFVVLTARAQFTYTTNADNTLTITGYSGPDGVVIIPPNINDLPVTGIGNYAFDNNGGLTSVTVGTNVTSIGYLAFAECTSLTNVILPDSITSIGNGAFSYCGALTSIAIPSGVTNVGETEFAFSGLTNITIASSVKTIDISAFEECFSLRSAEIPDGVTNIGLGAFDACTSLTTITIPASVAVIGPDAFSYCNRLSSIYFIGNAPETDPTAFANFDGLPDLPAYDNTTVYYMPGTTGWDEFATNTGVSAVLWNALIQTDDGSFGVRNNRFGFNIVGTTNIPVAVEACASLSNPLWQPLQTNSLTNGTFFFSDPEWTNYPGRFYRVTKP